MSAEVGEPPGEGSTVGGVIIGIGGVLFRARSES
jgi:hypothetical protein